MKRLFAVLLAVAVFMCCAAAGAEGTLEGKPYPNSYLYGNWPSERPAPEQAYDLYVNFDTYKDALAKGDVKTFSNLDTEEIGKYFIEKATAIIERMKRIELLDGVHPSGELEITEMRADLTGLSLSLDLAKKDKNFDYEKFFRAYAKLYSAYVPSREEIMSKNQYDPHPSPHIRINYEVAQFEEFYKTYPSVTEGTPMYIAPEDRILVW